MERLIANRPYNLQAKQVEIQFGTITLAELRDHQAKREAREEKEAKEEEKRDPDPAIAFMANDRESIKRLISATLHDMIDQKKKDSRKK